MQDLFYLLFPGNKHQKLSYPHFSVNFSLKDLKNKGPTLHNPSDFSVGNKKSRYKKQCPLKHSHLWTSQLESSSKFRARWIRALLSDWSSHGQPGHERTHALKTFFCPHSTRNLWSGSRTLRTAAELFCWLSPDPVDFTTSEPGKCKVDSQSKAGGNGRQEPREVLQGEALTHSQ